MSAFVYILECADGSLYTGWTDDLERRLRRHNAGRGAKYTRSRLPVRLVYHERADDKPSALRREIEIKKLSRAQKLCLIHNNQKEKSEMGKIPTLEEARGLLRRYNSEEFHLRHAEIVSGVMGWFAQRSDPDNREFWEVVGLLHDLDFERWPEQHCVKEVELMREEGLDERLVRACASHGWGMTGSQYEPEHIMEKTLFAVDELTGLIGAVAIMRPSKSVSDLELKSVKKKFKQPSFAAGCSRETISRGAEMMGAPLDELITDTIEAMRSLADRMEI